MIVLPNSNVGDNTEFNFTYHVEGDYKLDGEDVEIEDPVVYISVSAVCGFILIITLILCLLYKRKEM